MSNIIKCENCGCEEIDIIHKYKGYYVCPKCGRDTERLYEIEHDKEVGAKAIDKFVEKITLEISKNFILSMLANYENYGVISDKIVDYVTETSKKIAEQMKAGGKNE